MSQSPQRQIASAPFENSKGNADIILRSSDNTDFYVHKVILALVSSVFEDMFKSSVPGEDVDRGSGLPFVHLAEPGLVLDHLLRLCYPFANPAKDSEDLAHIGNVLAAAMKYDMEETAARMRKALLAYVSQAPIRVYAIACRLHLEEEAKVAAAAVTGLDIIEYEPEMDLISAGAFHRLLEYRRTTVQPPSFTFYTPVQETVVSSGGNPCATVPPHFLHPSADTIIQCSDGVEFHVHKFILSLASPVFTELLDRPATTTKLLKDKPNLQSLVVKEDSGTFLKVLQLCYPVEKPIVNNLSEAHTLLHATIKYKISNAIPFAKEQWRERMDDNPLRAYFLSMELGRTKAAREAALHCSAVCFDRYIPEMEDAPASTYHRLLCFRSAYLQGVHHVLCKAVGFQPTSLYETRYMKWNLQKNCADLGPNVPRVVLNTLSLAVVDCLLGSAQVLVDVTRLRVTPTRISVQLEKTDI